MAEVSIIVASHNARDSLNRCLTSLDPTSREVILVDNASSDGSPELVRERFPNVRLVALKTNRGYGAALNAGMKLANGSYFLLMNGDAWATEGSVERLLGFAEAEPSSGIVGPRTLNPDGSLQRSVRGFPTLWRLATEYYFLRWLAPRSQLLNAFYAGGFDHDAVRDAEFLVGAVLLLRRAAFEAAGGFDESFFMFNEEVDLCYRVRAAGWRVVFFPGAEFVHIGGASTGRVWPEMYREQLRSHLRFIAKHEGPVRAEQARTLLLTAMRLRSHVFRGERKRLSRDAAAWLSHANAETLLNG